MARACRFCGTRRRGAYVVTYERFETSGLGISHATTICEIHLAAAIRDVCPEGEKVTVTRLARPHE